MPPTIEADTEVPTDFPWPDGVSLVQAQVKKKFIAFQGHDTRTVEELFEVMHDELVARDLDVINTDYEGFEAELYFAKADNLAGIVSLSEGPCDGYVRVHVLYDPLETAEGREAVRKTRRLSGQG